MGMECHITKWLNSERQESRPCPLHWCDKLGDFADLKTHGVPKILPLWLVISDRETMGFGAYLAWNPNHCFIALLFCHAVWYLCNLSTKSIQVPFCSTQLCNIIYPPAQLPLGPPPKIGKSSATTLSSGWLLLKNFFPGIVKFSGQTPHFSTPSSNSSTAFLSNMV